MSTLNQKTCTSCEHFDPVLRGQPGGTVRETVWGWCTLRSIYPTKEGPGQKFPEAVRRAEEGQLAKPYIVKKGQVVLHCYDYVDRQPRLSKIDLLKELQKST